MFTRLALLFAALCLALLLVACNSGQPSTPTAVSQPLVPTATAGLPVSADATDAPPASHPTHRKYGDTFRTAHGRPTGFSCSVDRPPPPLVAAGDLPRLRSWAVSSNPIWAQGWCRCTAAKADMDAGRVPGQDRGSREYEEYGVEKYAELFAFHVADRPGPGSAGGLRRARPHAAYVRPEPGGQRPRRRAPFRAPDFFAPTSNRSRWRGEAWMFTVDWIYPTLTLADKATIRQVFLQWADQIVQNGYHHPEPVGVLNDPALVSQGAQRPVGRQQLLLRRHAQPGPDGPGPRPGRRPGQPPGPVPAGRHRRAPLHDRLPLSPRRAGRAGRRGLRIWPAILRLCGPVPVCPAPGRGGDPARWGPQVQLLAESVLGRHAPGHFPHDQPRPVAIRDSGRCTSPRSMATARRTSRPISWRFTPLGLYDARPATRPAWRRCAGSRPICRPAGRPACWTG